MYCFLMLKYFFNHRTYVVSKIFWSMQLKQRGVSQQCIVEWDGGERTLKYKDCLRILWLVPQMRFKLQYHNYSLIIYILSTAYDNISLFLKTHPSMEDTEVAPLWWLLRLSMFTWAKKKNNHLVTHWLTLFCYLSFASWEAFLHVIYTIGQQPWNTTYETKIRH